MIKYKKFFYIVKIVVLSALFIAALYFENAQQQRLFVLVALFLLFVLGNIIKYFLDKKSNLYFMMFALDLVFIYLLEVNSRLLINYFLHLFYVIVLLESSVTLETKKGIIKGTLNVLVSMVKFVYLIYFRTNLSSISQMVFFLIINVLIFVIAIFAQHSRAEKEKKDLLYKEILDAHKKLKEYMDEVRRLSVIEERNRIARDIHDSLGHNMTALIMQLQMAEHYLKNGSSKAHDLLVESVKTAKGSLSEIREVVETLRGTAPSFLADEALKALVEDFSEKTGVHIDLKVKGKPLNNREASDAVYHILKESLTNAVRHGNAAEVYVDIEYSDSTVNFNIRDNGEGAEKITEGYGMQGIRERVNHLSGSVDFISDGGFTVRGYLCIGKA